MTLCGFVIGIYAPWALKLLNWTVILAFVPKYVKEITFILAIISTILTYISAFAYFKGVFNKKI
jgi:hypothetical protein